MAEETNSGEMRDFQQSVSFLHAVRMTTIHQICFIFISQ